MPALFRTGGHLPRAIPMQNIGKRHPAPRTQRKEHMMSITTVIAAVETEIEALVSKVETTFEAIVHYSPVLADDGVTVVGVDAQTTPVAPEAPAAPTAAVTEAPAAETAPAPEAPAAA